MPEAGSRSGSRFFAQSTIDALASHICVLDEAGVIVSVNQTWRRFEQANSTTAPGEQVGAEFQKSWRYCEGANYLDVCDKVVGPEAKQAAAVAEAIRAVLRGECEEFSTEYPCHSPTERRWFLCRVSQFSNQQQRQVVLEHISITDRKVAEDALAENKARYQAVLDNSRDCLYQYNLQTARYEYISPTVERMIGYSPAEMIELDWASSMALVHPEHRTAVVAALAHVEETGQGEMEYLQGTKSGDYRWISTRMFLARDGAGKPLYRYGSARDVTEFRNAETALREKESQYRALFENNLDAIFMSVPDGTILSANPAACAMFGMTEEELCRSGRGPRVADENLNLAIGERGRTGSFKGELLLVRKDGTPFIGEVSSVLLPGDKQRSFVIVHDATDRKRAETERARLVLSIEQVNESVVITDVDGFIVYVNPGFEKLSGYKRAEVMGSNPRILKSGRHPASTYQQMWAILLRGEVWSGNLVNKRRDGTLYNEEATISPIKDQDGKIISFVGVGRDVTDELLLRDQLNQAQKMETVGRLAGGIAHDFNNLMMVIRTYTELMQAEFSAEHRAQRYAEQVIKALERGTSLTSQMLAFSRRRVASTVALDLNGVLAEAARMLKQVIGEDIDFRVTPADSVWAIEADPDLIFQVLMNFCVNARDAMPQGGTLTLATENTSVNHAGIDGHPYVLPGEYVKLTVTDNGTGMSKDTQARIFEPFFTTKEVGKGTGLGLAMVYGVVKQSSGYVWVDSEVGQGTCFTLYLPRISRAATPPAPAKHDALPTGTETILIVEDEVLLSKGISEFLISLGYKVLAANSGSEALALAAEHEHIDLLLTDLVMPQMSGTELAHVLGSLRPALKAIFMSGYVEHELDHCGEQQPHFLQKPFGLNKLACRVRNALDGTEPPQ